MSLFVEITKEGILDIFKTKRTITFTSQQRRSLINKATSIAKKELQNFSDTDNSLQEYDKKFKRAIKFHSPDSEDLKDFLDGGSDDINIGDYDIWNFASNARDEEMTDLFYTKIDKFLDICNDQLKKDYCTLKIDQGDWDDGPVTLYLTTTTSESAISPVLEERDDGLDFDPVFKQICEKNKSYINKIKKETESIIKNEQKSDPSVTSRLPSGFFAWFRRYNGHIRGMSDDSYDFYFNEYSTIYSQRDSSLMRQAFPNYFFEVFFNDHSIHFLALVLYSKDKDKYFEIKVPHSSVSI